MDDVSGATTGEMALRRKLLGKDSSLRAFLAENRLEEAADPSSMLAYLVGIKDALGNFSNDIGFVATLLIKRYLLKRFGIDDFDAGGKAQGAAGIDVISRTPGGLVVIGELKTTKPYQPGFGAQQRTTILKDLDRLQRTSADHRLMFVTDPETFQTLCGRTFADRAPDVEVVDLVSGRSSRA